MPRHARQLSETGVYHVMFRGVNRDVILLDHEDHARFLYALALVKADSLCAVLAYCLMPNHVHLLLRTDAEPLALTMKRLGVRYASWFNRKYERSGHVFQDRFRSQPVEDDTYFITVVRYVWNNPVRAGLAHEPSAYRWNSCAPGQPVGLVDESRLDDLLPSLARTDLTAVMPPSSQPTQLRGRRPGHSQAEVARLLRQSCGAVSSEQFATLDSTTQRRAIVELRTQSVAYAAIAAATGLSRAQVQRINASGTPTVE